MALSLYDTARRAVVAFVPLQAGRATLYHCGPTVYSTAHVGNFRSFLLADLLRRHLEASGYEVRQVMNITDVGHLTEDDRADGSGEDKLHVTANRLGWDPYRVAKHFEAEFHRDRARLGLRDAHHYPRATAHVPHMLALIDRLLARGHAYIVDGEAYFDVQSFPAYGELSGRRVEEQRAGARVAVRQGKRRPEDFAMWKVDPSHLMQFDPHDPALWRESGLEPIPVDPRLKRGFPGWHIECSAMSMHYLGDAFDIHTGGEDNLFPHHECEVAQSTAATGKPLARMWLHARHLQVNGRKLSKRDGTALTLDDLAERGFEPAVVRFALLSHHYRKPMNLSDAALVAAKQAVARLREVHDALRAQASRATAEEPASAGWLGDFRAALDDDLNVPNALVALFDAVGRWQQNPPQGDEAAQALRDLEAADVVLGVLDEEQRNGFVSMAELEASLEEAHDAVARMLAARHQARQRRDWAEADRLREALQSQGITLRDCDDGVAWCKQLDVQCHASHS